MGDDLRLTCDEVESSIPWFLDDELDSELSLGLEAHLRECASCRRVLESEGRLRVALRNAAQSMGAPVRLRRRLHESVLQEQRTQSVWARRWPAVAAAAVLCVFAWKGAFGDSADELYEAAARHTGDLPMDVVAADLASVQKYFSGKLPFAVDIPELSERPKLLGGRVIQINNRDAAYVRYEMPQGRVSMFVYEGPSSALTEGGPVYQFGNLPVVLRRVHGLTTMRWQHDGLVYSLVSDLPERELPAPAVRPRRVPLLPASNTLR